MAIAATTNESLDNTVTGVNAKNNTSQDLQNNFLTLLVAQLKNQDPTNPMQNNELTTQLAQINTAYEGALMSDGSVPEAARAFIRFMAEPDARARWVAAKLEPLADH